MPIPRWIGLALGITCLQSSFGYTPGSISGKYASDTIDTGLVFETFFTSVGSQTVIDGTTMVYIGIGIDTCSVTDNAFITFTGAAVA